MRKLFAAMLVSLALAPLALAQDVSVDFDKTADFSKIKTFAVKVASPADDPLAEKVVVSSVTQAISSKGWTQAPEASADAMVMINGASETRRKLNAYGGGGWRMGGGMASAQLDDYKVGTLVVDVFDAKSKSLLFRGKASGELSDKAEKRDKTISKAVTKMFQDFPPGAGKK
jgi:hypothetical protein